MDDSLKSQAAEFMGKLSSQCAAGHGLGSMSCSIYDTAWVSMIPSPSMSGEWLFPECFEYILKTQLLTGAWPIYTTILDGILNTAAGLLALKKHWKIRPDAELSRRFRDAEKELRSMLENWDFQAADQVGFELLVFKHLCLLRDEGVNIHISSDWEKLRALHDSKLSKIPLSNIYKAPSTLLHSLEALVGVVDFDKVRHLREPNGSMMGSPSSTAAYLIYSTEWDEQSESYLRTVLSRDSNQQQSSVPSAWPTTIFELSWVVTTFASVGIPVAEFDTGAISVVLETSFVSGRGVVGFSGTALPDADDTAKSITALHYLGRQISVDPLLQAYEGESCFKTYLGERNPSVSANCNVLICLLTRDNPMEFYVQITKILRFVSHQMISDASNEKWHCHRFYSQMLLAEAFALLHSLRKSSLLRKIFRENTLLQDEIVQISLHMLIGILNTQQLDGCWYESCEITAYAVLALSFLLRLPLVTAQENIAGAVLNTIEAGKSYLMVHRDQWSTGRRIWIEKVTYASTILSEAYCIAAAVAPVHIDEVHDWFFETLSSSKTVDRRIRSAQEIIQDTRLFKSADKHILDIAEVQARYSMSYLESRRLDLFPRDGIGEDKYLAFIPLTWTACSSINNAAVGIGVLREMMVLSMLNYQVDEFMETVVVGELAEEPELVKSMIRQLFWEIKTSPKAEKDVRKATPSLPLKMNGTEYPKMNHIRTILSRYIMHILRNRIVLQSPTRIQQWLAMELEKFLLAHVTQAADNHRLRSTKTAEDTNISSLATQGQFSLNQTFHNWVRSTSADHTSCVFSLIFYICLVAKRAGMFATSKVAYITEDLCCRLANMVRMYNDYGSVKRDRMEGNLNSMDFPEFTESKSETSDLMWIAEYERRAVELALGQLRVELEAKGQGEVMVALRLFYNVADLYGLIYVQKDIASQLK